MTRIKISQLIWDVWNTEHIKNHHTTKEEVEEAIRRVGAHRQGYLGRVVLIGRAGKRILALIVKPTGNNQYYLVTARDADQKERRLLYANERK